MTPDRDAVVDIPALRHWWPDIAAGTVRRWAHEGWLRRRGQDYRGRGLYRLGDVLDMRRGACNLTDRPRS